MTPAQALAQIASNAGNYYNKPGHGPAEHDLHRDRRGHLDRQVEAHRLIRPASGPVARSRLGSRGGPYPLLATAPESVGARPSAAGAAGSSGSASRAGTISTSTSSVKAGTAMR